MQYLLKEWKLKDFIYHLTPQVLEHEPMLTKETSFRYNYAKFTDFYTEDKPTILILTLILNLSVILILTFIWIWIFILRKLNHEHISL